MIVRQDTQRVSLGKRVRPLLVMALMVLASNHAKAADELQNLRNAITAYQTHHTCPPNGIYDILHFESYCKVYCDRGITCHGNKDTDPCTINDMSDDCHQFEEGTQQCLSDMNEKNKVVLDYNRIVRQCHSQQKASAPFSPTPSKQAGGGLVGESQQAQHKLDEARAKAREALNKAAQEKAKQEAEKQKLKEEARAPSPACQQAVAACEQRNSGLSNVSSSTQSECAAYCRNMQIENCNPNSPTLQQGAQACTAGAERDRKEAEERAAEERRRAAALAQAQRCRINGPLTCCGSLEACLRSCNNRDSRCSRACAGGNDARARWCYFHH